MVLDVDEEKSFLLVLKPYFDDDIQFSAAARADTGEGLLVEKLDIIRINRIVV